jgi:hypothetical protein
MPEHPTTTPSAVDRFWDRFVDRARKNGVKEPAIRWHVRRAEQHLKGFAGKTLAEHSVQDVTGCLEGVGRIGRIGDWQLGERGVLRREKMGRAIDRNPLNGDL